MAMSKKEPSLEQLNTLRRQIQEWRQKRTVPGAMPGVLWDQAVALAKDLLSRDIRTWCPCSERA
jgi:hypothetical protein